MPHERGVPYSLPHRSTPLPARRIEPHTEQVQILNESPQRNRNAVEKVIVLVAASRISWEDAARRGVAEATKTIRDLSVAHVEERDVMIVEGEIALYRIKLRVAFRVDRMRPGLTPGAPDVEVTRWLIVANQTLGTGEVVAEIDRLNSHGPCEFHLLVPMTHSKSYARARRLSMLAADPVTGIPSEHVPAADYLGPDTFGMEQAQKRLDAQLAKIAAASYAASGELGDPDPLRAIQAVLSRSSFDGIILSTLPAGASRLVGADLPSRVRRLTRLPVTYLPGREPGEL